ncbi:hypothetical protein [Streptomyces sp. MZ04]|uniref:hypothetical protein n=1 Tax=Streptomyces sp. MZ04 TaxID=2559236 RepID=UPI00107E7D1A|nr:hypothetical protein [Streptomyces sp. MZ04]TGB15502.1 hypothetical protein E2651_02440 [Streptomyces sp. MZ04]
MRKVHAMAAVVLAGLVLSGCGADSDEPQKPGSTRTASADAKQSPTPKASAQGTMIERATGSWTTISKKRTATSLETVTIEDGQVTAKGGKLDCSGTLKPRTKGGKESPTLALSCKGGSDGGRGLGTLYLMDKETNDDALAFDWEGPEGGWGGPVDSFRRDH